MTPTQSADLLVTNADLFTGDRNRPHLRPGAVAIRDGVLAAVGPEAEVLASFDAGRSIDARGAIVHPGFIDPHLHLLTIPFHGLPVDPDGRSRTMVSYASLKTETDEDAVAAFSAAAAVALLRRGFTLFVEPGTVFETDALAETVARCGTRAMVSAPYGWDDVSIFLDLMPGTITDRLLARAPARTARVVDRCAQELKRNHDRNALVRAFVCLYGEGSGSDELIGACAALARHHGAVFNQHQGYLPEYDRAEREMFGLSGVARLDRLGALGPRTALTHMNIMEPADADRVAATGTAILWSPLNALHRGLHAANRCHHPGLYKAGHTVALAVDSVVSYPLGSAALAALLLSGSVGDRLAPSDPFYMQTIDAAKSVGLDDRLGSLSVGKRADLVIRSPGDLTQTALDDLGSILGTSSSLAPVDTVIVDGRVILQGGRLSTMDEDEILATARRHRDKILRTVAA